MTFGHAERRKKRDNQLDNVAREANASSSSLPGSVWFGQNPSNQAQTLSNLRVGSQKMGACGQRNKINQSLELEDLKHPCQSWRQRDDTSAWLLLWRALVESCVVLPARLGWEAHVDPYFLRQSDEQTAQRCARFWQHPWCNATSHGQFFVRNDSDTLVVSLRPLPNVTHVRACKILAGTGPKPKKMVNGPNLLCDSFVWLLLSCFSAFAPVASAKNKGVLGNLIKFLLDLFYSQHSQFHSVSTKSTQKLHFRRLRCLILGLGPLKGKCF